MTYKQYLSSAMLAMGEENRAEALLQFQAALAEARRIDPGGPREAEVLNYMVLFHEQGGEEAQALPCREMAHAIAVKFEVSQ